MSASSFKANRASFKGLLLAVVAMLLVGAIALTGNALQAQAASSDPNNPTQVRTWSELVDAVKDGGYIQVMNTIYARSPITIDKDVTIDAADSGATIRPRKLTGNEGDTTYEPMFTVTDGGKLTIGKNITMSGQVESQQCGSESAITADQFTGGYDSDEAATYTPKGFFIEV